MRNLASCQNTILAQSFGKFVAAKNCIIRKLSYLFSSGSLVIFAFALVRVQGSEFDWQQAQ